MKERKKAVLTLSIGWRY